ncbi:hypothetical protein KFK09_012776 [Dendrobium nobile]|uniref:Uncharacterized protein n=1 Tax=Dendrobium nobile TaxID=94219 RepID=A0A8T3BIP4_DENNO|nr:hypothetical protein KFK09_012776 [Dendrobium nobile]
MATSVSTVGSVNRVPQNFHGSSSGASAPSSAIFGNSLKKTNPCVSLQEFPLSFQIHYD